MIFSYVIPIFNPVCCCCKLPGSFGGGPTLEIQGAGFGTEDDTTVTVCDNVCAILNITESVIECDVPPNSGKTQMVLDMPMISLI